MPCATNMCPSYRLTNSFIYGRHSPRLLAMAPHPEHVVSEVSAALCLTLLIGGAKGQRPGVAGHAKTAAIVLSNTCLLFRFGTSASLKCRAEVAEGSPMFLSFCDNS